MSAYDPKRTLMPPPVPIENALFHVTLAGAIAAGMFGGGGHGPDSTPTKAALSEIGASLKIVSCAIYRKLKLVVNA
jgi:hypothetical protein